jgi:serine/threonine protein kinase
LLGPLRPGDPSEVGPYRLTDRLGSGGMGQVFLGRSQAGRLVAVKLVRSELSDDPEFRRRFAHEVDAARRVGGFYTAPVVATDPEADPPWLATAFMSGPSLQKAVSTNGPLPLDAVRTLGAGVAEGLVAIHKCGLVHRDLKPGNVILAADGPRLIDFGIARAMDATQHTSAVIGTPGFMSPEQAKGRPVGPASDVFSLGALMVFAATGGAPFGSGAVDAVIFRVVHEPADLSDVPAPLTDLITACLAKDPADRPTLASLLDQLTTSTATHTPAIRQPTAATRMLTAQLPPAGSQPDFKAAPAVPALVRRFPKRPAKLGAAGLLATAAVVGSVALLWHQHPASPTRHTQSIGPTATPTSQGQPPVNLALNKSVIVSSQTPTWGWAAADATNGDTTPTADGAHSGWASQADTSTSATEWIEVDLGSVHLINEVDLYPRNDSDVPGGCFPRDFRSR